jgi:hypothetical protein
MSISAVMAIAACACLEPEPRPTRWGFIHATIIQPACATAGCHSVLTAAAGVTLASREGAYTMLTGRICGEPPSTVMPPRHFVTPYAPETSQLYYLLRGERVDLMPPDNPLPDADIELVARWIEDGAACD